MTGKNIVLVGSSTGGPVALKELFQGMPRLSASVVLVQHMPFHINESVRRSLDAVTDMEVRLAKDRALLEPGVVYVAPSGPHTVLTMNRWIKLVDGDKVNFCRPSVDVLMMSATASANDDIVAVVLTGMGRDGACGVVHVKAIGGTTYAQDQKTSTIYGMPKAAKETGRVDFVLSPAMIRKSLIDRFGPAAGSRLRRIA